MKLRMPTLSIPQSIVLAVMLLSMSLTAIFAPPHFWAVVTGADWPWIFSAVTSLVVSVIGVFVTGEKNE